ncbi:MAG: phosphoribosylamine---glycine ligase [Sphingomonadales bacterium]|jgi:phosphoribosylamine--glycine ligase|nr:phosphoribosylamine---glycine ligase [Sphingomonadales bacterium]
MRFLGVTETCDLGSLYRRLLAEGHEVRVSIEEEGARGTMAGLVPRVDDWRGELGWVGREGIILFEAVSEGYGALQDDLRRDGYRVIGGSAFGDRLENDRAFAQALLAGLGLQTAAVHRFDDAASGDAFLAARPARYVLKFSGPDFASSDNYVGQRPDGADVRAVLARRFAVRGGAAASYILMEHVEGVEMGVGAYFDGDRFLAPACLDWEHKRFFADDMGELTGEMGTVATFERSGKFFDLTLARVAPRLRAHGHVGYVNLNTIVNETGIWPLEFTCRFGYPGFAILEPLQGIGWGELFRAMAERSAASFPTRPGFSAGIVLTTPPFPYTRKQINEPVGLPVLFDGELDDEDRRNLHYGEVGLDGGRLVTSGLYGWTMVVTGVGPTIAAARDAAYERVGRVFVPNARYRLDIGDRLVAGDYDKVAGLGLFSDVRAPIVEADR